MVAWLLLGCHRRAAIGQKQTSLSDSYRPIAANNDRQQQWKKAKSPPRITRKSETLQPIADSFKILHWEGELLKRALPSEIYLKTGIVTRKSGTVR